MHEKLKNLLHKCPSDLRHIIDCLQEKRSSSWLTSLSIEQHGFVLYKGALRVLCTVHV